MSVPHPPDEAARARARTDLDANLVVEAGAGSGKTTLMAQRIVALLADGRDPTRIAAVTFTRKAAGELRERLQLQLEARGLDAALAQEVTVGTIHGFCARLLRERPIEAGLDPRFRELDEDEAGALADAAWRDWLDRCHAEGDAGLAALEAVGIEAASLREAFGAVVRFPDVDFGAPPVPAPDIAPVQAALEPLLATGAALLPPEEPAAGWDDVQVAVLRLLAERRVQDWRTPRGFLDSVALVAESPKEVQQRWVRGRTDAKAEKADAKAFAEAFRRWRQGPAADALRQWREHRYGPAIAFVTRAARAFERMRLAAGLLSFEDLLLRAAALLRDDPEARRALGEQWRHVLVDEFQDTDPVQAELLFLLGSEPTASETGDWAAVTLRPGALFVVGDPKQSIYRFRRADIETYERARAAIERHGALLRLTANFRSTAGIATVVNAHFGARGTFPAVATPQQAAFAPLEPVPRGGEAAASAAHPAIARHEVVLPRGDAGKARVIAEDAARLASWIATECEAGRLAPAEVLILTRTRAPLAAYARALSERGLPVAVSGAHVGLEAEVQELVTLLALMRDPDNAVLVAAVLEGRFFGAAPADLWAAHAAGLAFTVLHAPPATAPDAASARVRDALACLHGWLARARTEPADVFLARVLDETGLLARTAADDLGDVRAGFLLRLVEEVRLATLDPAVAGDAAQATLARLITGELPDAPLLPGRTDAVRVMNLHKAKGLEADVVLLAAPLEVGDHAPTVAVTRAAGRAVGGLVIEERRGRQRVVHAQPPGWEAMADAERAFAAAERDRLLYVATTRARRALLVSEFVEQQAKGPKKPEDRAWSALAPTLDALAAPMLTLADVPAAGRPALTTPPEALARDVAQVALARAQAAVPSFAHTTVTRAAKADTWAARALDDVPREGRSAGAAWGRAVHRLLEEAARAGDPFPVDAAAARVAAEEGIAPRTTALAALVRHAMTLDPWRALMAATARRLEWPVAAWDEVDGRPTYVEGVVDAAYRTDAGWHVLDWKTDDVDDATWAARLPAYDRQVATYARILARALGVPVTGAVVRVVAP